MHLCLTQIHTFGQMHYFMCGFCIIITSGFLHSTWWLHSTCKCNISFYIAWKFKCVHCTSAYRCSGILCVSWCKHACFSMRFPFLLDLNVKIHENDSHQSLKRKTLLFNAERWIIAKYCWILDFIVAKSFFLL